ncbi:hypothetical protein [Granulicella tundricola]|uniref:Antitoxin n=1 Tax=Granulicella tundricola (strain ATCC BAA-1859 / DSM 23138 / MP5ACTX9) TaxID=1198114 RepID=E8WW15_GRATM|nr:hypothetical protein [Granulicella tundricola]ADW67321.1 hypothetical protein AciX9_0247 [Granulicella tundricola MP5ACTX9]
MRTTIDIPDPIYRELKARAAREGTSVKQIILRSVASAPAKAEAVSAKVKGRYPLLSSKEPGALKLGEEGVYEYIPFP